MENGLRPINDEGDMAPAVDTKTGKPVAPHYIQRIVADVGGKPVFEAQWGPSISANPFVAFEVQRPAPGATLSLRWKDNQGQSGQTTHNLGN
jgi:sulfur-oxidizing protein SoxZ